MSAGNEANDVVTGERIAALCEFNCDIVDLIENDRAFAAVGFRLYERDYRRFVVVDVLLLILVLESGDYL